MKKTLLLFFLLISSLGFTQTKKSETDSIFFTETYYQNHFFTVGPTFSLSESLIGLQLGNGNDEQPIIHFEDLSAEILYKVSGQTDFQENYSIGTEVSWNYPFKARLSILTINFNQAQISDRDFFHRNQGLATRYYLRFAHNLSVLAKLSHQQFNGQYNVGFGLGLQNEHRGFYYGIRADYFDDYYNYAVFLQSFLFNDKISLRLTYDLIENFDFLNIGLSYVMIRSTERTVRN